MRSHQRGGEADGAGARVGGAAVVRAGKQRQRGDALAGRECERRLPDAHVQLPLRAPRVAGCRVHAAQLHCAPIREIHLNTGVEVDFNTQVALSLSVRPTVRFTCVWW